MHLGICLSSDRSFRLPTVWLLSMDIHFDYGIRTNFASSKNEPSLIMIKRNFAGTLFARILEHTSQTRTVTIMNSDLPVPLCSPPEFLPLYVLTHLPSSREARNIWVM